MKYKISENAPIEGLGLPVKEVGPGYVIIEVREFPGQLKPYLMNAGCAIGTRNPYNRMGIEVLPRRAR